MGMMKNYLLKVLEQCSEEKFGQDAIEWAILSGLVRLSYQLPDDIHRIMPKYDEIIEAYRRWLAQAHEQHRKAHAPMKRAVPHRRVESGTGSKSSGERKRSA